MKQDADDVTTKRRGNLGELASEQFCREYLPVEMWDWENEEALRKCNPESFSPYDFEASAFRPPQLLDQDPDDDIIVMVWHRDNEDGLILLGWERVETLHSKVATQEAYSGDEPTKLDHLAARPMNELMDLGPNTAHMNQKPQNPFSPGDRVVKSDDEDASVAVVKASHDDTDEAVVVDRDEEATTETISVVYSGQLAEGEASPVKLASHCEEQQIKQYSHSHTDLEWAE